MPRLLREISSVSRWGKTDGNGGLYLDVILDMKPKKNKLSFWRYENENELIPVILAMISTHQQLDTCITVSIDEEEMKLAGFNFEESKGKTIFIEYENNHVNLINLKVKELNQLALIINKNLLEKKSTIIDKEEILKRYIAEIIDKKVALHQFNGFLKKDIADTANFMIASGAINEGNLDRDFIEEIRKIRQKKTDCPLEEKCIKVYEI